MCTRDCVGYLAQPSCAPMVEETNTGYRVDQRIVVMRQHSKGERVLEITDKLTQ